MYSILYVDDEEALLDLGKIFLERDGTMAVETLTSAAAALDRIKSVPFDVVISDYQMPDMDGIEFLKAVRARFSDLPFILFTGRGREEVVIQAINNGADFYLQKGGDPGSQFAELSHKVKMAIERRRANLALQRETTFTQAIFDSVPGILYLYDSAGRLVRWNKNHETLTGYSGAELGGRHVLDWFPDETDKKTILDGISAAESPSYLQPAGWRSGARPTSPVSALKLPGSERLRKRSMQARRSSGGSPSGVQTSSMLKMKTAWSRMSLLPHTGSLGILKKR
jgi:DNA-binding response OmpR family regulator